MAVKTGDNSVLDPVEDLTEAEAPESFLTNKLKRWRTYPTAFDILGRLFQTRQRRSSNSNINNSVLWDWATKGEYTVVLFDKERTKGVAFQPNYGPPREADNSYLAISEHISNWVDYPPTLELVEKFRLASSETVNRIKKFAFLDENWDSYGAKTIEWSTIIKAIDFFSSLVVRLPDNAALPFVAPAGNGDIHFEWEMLSKALALSIPEDKNDAFEYVLTDKTSGKEGETYERVSSMEEIIDIAANWIRR